MKGYVGILLVEVYERVEKFVISVCKRLNMAKRWHLLAVKKSIRH